MSQSIRPPDHVLQPITFTRHSGQLRYPPLGPECRLCVLPPRVLLLLLLFLVLRAAAPRHLPLPQVHRAAHCNTPHLGQTLGMHLFRCTGDIHRRHDTSGTCALGIHSSSLTPGTSVFIYSVYRGLWLHSYTSDKSDTSVRHSWGDAVTSR